jgi:hypothetical protein
MDRAPAVMPSASLPEPAPEGPRLTAHGGASKPSARFPQLVNEGGPILAHPRVVPVFFSNDPDREAVETFVKELGASETWSRFGHEYGIDAFPVGKSIVADASPPPAIDAQAVAELLDALAAHDPDRDANTLYSLTIPEGTRVEILGMQNCREYLGYHLRSDTGRKITYAVSAKCPVLATNASAPTPLDQLTGTISHELVEAVTNPGFLVNPAFGSADADHLAWNLANGLNVVEVGDMCEFDPMDDVHVPGVAHMIQRYWSNAAAAAGKDPCLPSVPGRAYANAIPDVSDTVTVGGQRTRGLIVSVGETRTIDVELVSDRDDAPPWTVTAHSVGDPNDPPLTFEWRGANAGTKGDVLHLAVTGRHAPKGGIFGFWLESGRAGDSARAYWYVVVAGGRPPAP